MQFLGDATIIAILYGVALFVCCARSDSRNDQYRSNFERTLADGPSVETGADPTEIAIFYVLSLVELGLRLAKDTREVDGAHFFRIVNEAGDILSAVRTDDQLPDALQLMRSLFVCHWDRVEESVVRANELIDPLQQRGAELVGQLSSADAEKVSRMVGYYKDVLTNSLPVLQAQTGDRLRWVFDNFAAVTEEVLTEVGGDVSVAQTRWRSLFVLTVRNIFGVLDEFSKASLNSHNKVDTEVLSELPA